MVLLVPDNKTEDDYSKWSGQIGKPSDLGVQLQIAISYSDRSGPHVVATGTIGVPRPPEDDFERQLLAAKIADLVEAPDIAIFSFFGLLWWRVVEGGPFEVDLTEKRHVRQLDENEVSNRVSISGPGPMNEPVFRTEFPESDDWAREYADNRYLRFETRVSLNQRYQDLITNITVLTHTGQVTLTQEKLWHRLFKHVVIELFRCGEPPVPHNFHPVSRACRPVSGQGAVHASGRRRRERREAGAVSREIRQARPHETPLPARRTPCGAGVRLW